MEDKTARVSAEFEAETGKTEHLLTSKSPKKYWMLLLIAIIAMSSFYMGKSWGGYSARHQTEGSGILASPMNKDDARRFWATHHGWMSEDKARLALESANFINLAYVDVQGYFNIRYSDTSSISLATPANRWEIVKLRWNQKLTCTGTSVNYTNNGMFSFTVNMYQPFIQYHVPEYIYMVDVHCVMWRVAFAPPMLRPVAEVQQELPVQIQPAQ